MRVGACFTANAESLVAFFDPIIATKGATGELLRDVVCADAGSDSCREITIRVRNRQEKRLLKYDEDHGFVHLRVQCLRHGPGDGRAVTQLV